MGANTKIEWADHTFNPWLGCHHVSPGCDHCYAEAWAKRSGLVQWGPNAARRRSADANWKKPIEWNAQADAEGVRRRVFCASLADVFDDRIPPRWHQDLWLLISQTKHLDWLLLTKRPQNIQGLLPDDWGEGYPNVWLGCSAENQQRLALVGRYLQAIPAAVRFLSCEPLLEEIDIEPYLRCEDCGYSRSDMALHMDHHLCRYPDRVLDWVIVGGESGPGARPMNPSWARIIVNACEEAGTPVFFKQWGEWVQPADIEVPMRIKWPTHTFPDGSRVRRTGKKIAGRKLHGRTYDGIPTPRGVSHSCL